MTVNSKGGFVRTADAAHTDVEALNLRSSGLTYREIADKMNCDVATAYRRVSRCLAAVPVESVEEFRSVAMDRRDALHAAIWSQAMEGNLRAVDRILAIMTRRARLLGLDKPPEKSVETWPMDSMDAEMNRLTQILRDHDSHRTQD